MPPSPPAPTALIGTPQGRSERIGAASLWWLSDIAGAIVFATCVALLLGGWRTQGTPSHAGWLLAGVVLSGALRAGAQGLAGVTGHRAAVATKSALRARLLAALLPTGLARGRLVGEDLRIAIDDVEAQEGLVARFQPLRLAAVASPLLIALAVAFASWFSALILLTTLIPFGMGMALAGMAGKNEADRQFLALSRLSGLFVDRVAALPVILSFSAEDRVTRQIAGAATEVAARTMQVLRVAFVSNAMLEFFAALSVALVAVYCGFSLLGLLPFPAPEDLTLPRAFFALAMAPEFYVGMRRLAAAYHDKQQGEAAARGIAAALAEADSVRHPPSGLAAPTRPAVSLKQLEIAYPDGSRIGPVDALWPGPGLHAVAGPTGSGKSSLLHALIGMAPLARGCVRLNGGALPPGDMAAIAGWAGQRPLLLPGTLGENLLIGTAGRDDAELLRLLEACGLSRLIAARGLDLPIDPRGSGLSGGERRRIGLVRALLSDRPVLLLDEPTADLDPGSAHRVVALLEDVARTRLVIAATHDPLLIARAASVVTLP